MDFERSEEVRRRYAEPELNQLLLNILLKWENSINPDRSVSYTYTEKEYDITQVEELAETKYGITNSSEFINSLISYLEVTKLPPSKTILNYEVNDPENWLYVEILGCLPIFIFMSYHFFIEYLGSKTKKKVYDYMLYIPLLLLIYILEQLILNHPYDYRLISIQTLVAIIIGIGGIFAINRLITYARMNYKK